MNPRPNAGAFAEGMEPEAVRAALGSSETEYPDKHSIYKNVPPKVYSTKR